jgi:hypothetical protein
VDVVVARGFVRNYYAGKPGEKCLCCPGSTEGHSPYQGILHNTGTDERVHWTGMAADVLRGLEGEVVEIIVRRTGHRCEKADDPWVLLKGDRYGPRSQR